MPAYRRLRQKDCEFEASFAYRANLSLNMYVHTLAHMYAFTHVNLLCPKNDYDSKMGRKSIDRTKSQDKLWKA